MIDTHTNLIPNTYASAKSAESQIETDDDEGDQMAPV